jgi:hypothetical protein
MNKIRNLNSFFVYNDMHNINISNLKWSVIVLLGLSRFQMAKMRKMYQQINLAFQLQIISSYKHLK